MMLPSIPVLFCANGAYFQHTAVAIASLLENNRHLRFDLTIATDRHYPQEEELLAAVTRRFGNATLRFAVFSLARMKGLPTRLHLTVFTYMRLFAAEIFGDEVEKILYLDTDLVVCDDIIKLWAIPLGSHPIAAVPDIFIDRQRGLKAGSYANAGVLLINLKQWRRENAGAGLMAYIDTHPELEYLDQDALNAVFAGRIKILPLRWNFQARMAETDPKILGITKKEFRALRMHPGIVHYTTGSKPWMYRKDVHYTKLYQQHLARTPWHNQRALDKTLRRVISKKIRLIKFRRWIRWVKAGL